jgi:hypothetical protein
MVNRVKKMGRITGAIADASKTLLGKNLSRALSNTASSQVGMAGAVPMFKKGGKITKTGKIKVHKGEVVLSAPTVKTLKRIMKKKK